MIRVYISLVCILLLASCKSGKLHKKGVELGSDTTQVTETREIEKYSIPSINFAQIKFKSDVDIDSKAFSQKFPLTIHVEKDKAIWASVSIGLEIGRAKITPDSLMFMDRFNRKAYVGTWGELSRASNFDLNFGLLQSMLLGDPLFEVQDQDTILSDGNNVEVKQERAGKLFSTKVDNTYKKVFEIDGEDKALETRLLMLFKSFTQHGAQWLPSIINMDLSGKTAAKLEVKHNKVEFVNDGLSFSFSIPSNYRVEKLPGL